MRELWMKKQNFFYEEMKDIYSNDYEKRIKYSITPMELNNFCLKYNIHMIGLDEDEEIFCDNKKQLNSKSKSKYNALNFEKNN